jgi:hypothetical protein
MERDTFTRSFIQDGKYVIEEVARTISDITPLTGNAKIIYVGGNGRFKFLGSTGRIYTTQFTKPICTDDRDDDNENFQFYEYSQVTFDIDIEKEWMSLYTSSKDTTYWKRVGN